MLNICNSAIAVEAIGVIGSDGFAAFVLAVAVAVVVAVAVTVTAVVASSAVVALVPVIAGVSG